MEKTVLTFLMTMMVGVMMNASAQVCKNITNSVGKIGDQKHTPMPNRNVHHHGKVGATITYDASTSVLSVKFPPNGGTVTVSHNGTQVASMTANSGTTFHCGLRQYGTGNYTVIVSKGDTVLETKDFTVR